MLVSWLLIPVGIVIVVKAIAIGDFIGEIDWCERYIGSGGTYTFIKLFGLAVTLLSIMWLSGGPQDWLENTIGHLF